MSYRRHTAREDVLADPGERDITAHVNFTALAGARRRVRLATVRFETLAQTLLDAGEPDQFAAALARPARTRNCGGACSSRRCCSGWERRFGCCCRGSEKDERREKPEQ